MKATLLILFLIFCLCPGVCLYAQEEEPVIEPLTEAGEDLDLYGVLELFRESENLEAFEQALNDPTNEVNNLDLDENGEVDYIRVIEYMEGNTHVVVLQVLLGENEYQDVATIEIEDKGEGEYIMQIIGNEEIYGEGYSIEPNPEPAEESSVVVIGNIPIVRLMFAPGYTPWRSPWYWAHYPGWWKPWKPLPRELHRSRVLRFHRPIYRPATVRRSIRGLHIYKPHLKASPKAIKIRKPRVKKKPPKKKKD
jgi:hypothetical protein